jgi:hypothetical protein
MLSKVRYGPITDHGGKNSYVRFSCWCPPSGRSAIGPEADIRRLDATVSCSLDAAVKLF